VRLVLDRLLGEKAAVKPVAVLLRRGVDDADHHFAQEHVVGASHHHPEGKARHELLLQNQADAVLGDIMDGALQMFGGRDWLAGGRETAGAAASGPTVTDLRFVRHG